MENKFKNEFDRDAIDPLQKNKSRESMSVMSDKKYYRIINLSFF